MKSFVRKILMKIDHWLYREKCTKNAIEVFGVVFCDECKRQLGHYEYVEYSEETYKDIKVINVSNSKTKFVPNKKYKNYFKKTI